MEISCGNAELTYRSVVVDKLVIKFSARKLEE